MKLLKLNTQLINPKIENEIYSLSRITQDHYIFNIDNGDDFYYKEFKHSEIHELIFNNSFIIFDINNARTTFEINQLVYSIKHQSVGRIVSIVYEHPLYYNIYPHTAGVVDYLVLYEGFDKRLETHVSYRKEDILFSLEQVKQSLLKNGVKNE